MAAVWFLLRLFIVLSRVFAVQFSTIGIKGDVIINIIKQ